MHRNIYKHHGKISCKDREKLLEQQSIVIWLTGLSGSGKSTTAYALEQYLFVNKKLAYVFDGDNIRHGLCSDLGFTPEDRSENIRRIGETIKLFLDSGIISIAAFISPNRADRNKIRNIIPSEKFIEVYVKCPIKTCEARDPKGLYKLARSGVIQNYTGISSPYDPPLNPNITIDTEKDSINYNVNKIYRYISEKI